MIVIAYATKFKEFSRFFPHYNGEKNGNQNHGKPYGAPADKGDNKATYGKGTSGGGTPASVRCFNYGVMGHRANQCKSSGQKCFKCGKLVHRIVECKSICLTCYNCGEPGHISTKFQKPKKAQFRGKLNLKVSSMIGSMNIDTLTNGLASTLLVCLSYPLTIYGKDFGIDLIFLPLSQLDVILGMNWLEFNRVHIICFDKTMLFHEFEEGEDLMFMSANQVEKSLKDNARMFMMIASLKDTSQDVIGDLRVVCDFPDVFLDDTSDLSPEHEVEFAINLVPSTSLVLMAPYTMFSSELSEMKKQLEDMLKNKFVRPSVSPRGAPVLFVKKKDDNMRLFADYR
ncbi:uncharacterized protein LOC127103285 [Lathyrus oleraceus]|uniref:uncharacterized protein LOC127103285 n=1 Tax=Pisum sativum TaxID=3888 RepID=UPI0021CDF7C9|nr:uncharacterized protein LOC127103285 [Pisum sativum]